jgi:D-aminoacyl-tRNA deacylase
MNAVIQRVKNAAVVVEGQVVGAIQKGALIFLGVARTDTPRDVEYLARKIAELRMFEDAAQKMNLSAAEINGAFLVVSQFTLLGDCSKGRRPSFDRAAEPAMAEEYYNCFVSGLRARGFKVETGQFRAMMDVSLVNDGPVTFVMDSEGKT